MRYWRINDDLYTGDTAPVGAAEITFEEYMEIMYSRTITHIEPVEDEIVE